MLLVLQFAAYAVALWLGGYLLARQPLTRSLACSGIGLVAYAGALATDVLVDAGPGDAAPQWLMGLQWSLRLLPGICWLLALLPLTPVLAQREVTLPRARVVVVLSTLFFGLGIGLLLLPLPWLPRSWLMLAIGADLVAFGWVIAALDAFDAGEQLRADFGRSAVTALALVAVFGGQVALLLVMEAGKRLPLTALLLGVTAGAIGLQAFWDALQSMFDRVVFGGRSSLGERRAALRSAASALPRQPAVDDLLALPEEEFVSLTRRALSHFGDLPRLAASPLLRLPTVGERLGARDLGPGDVLERTAALKSLLAESIGRLKPAGEDAFGTTDEWRHYNALYFPYVLGLKPYSRRAEHWPAGRAAAEHDGSAAALLWLRTQVPERTLFNWQRAAARLVANDLRERARAVQAAQAVQAVQAVQAPWEAPPAAGAKAVPTVRDAHEACRAGELAEVGRSFPSHGSG